MDSPEDKNKSFNIDDSENEEMSSPAIQKLSTASGSLVDNKANSQEFHNQ